MHAANKGHSEQWGRFLETAQPFYRRTDSVGGRNHLLYYQAIASVYQGGAAIELGCGRGTISQYLTEHHPTENFTALDASGTALRRLREFFVERGMRLPRIVNAQADCVPAADSSYSLVCSVGLFEHFQPTELTAVLYECNRLVTPDGWNYHVVIYPTEAGPGMVQRYNVAPPVYAQIDVPNQTTRPLPAARAPAIETPSYVEYWSWEGKQSCEPE